MANEPIVKFYIKNYMSEGSLVSTETEFQTIPIVGDPVITSPKVKNEMGKAGSFEFGLERNSPLYDALLQMKTIMRVTYFGTTIFRGRVLTIDKTMSRTRTVHCEGDYAFLLDSPQKATEEDERSEITVLAYLQQIITAHNNYIDGDNYKKFTLGEVPGQYTANTTNSQRVKIPSAKAKQKFGDSSWNSSMDRLENLLKIFGGYFRTRYNAQNQTTYLDWYDRYYNSSVNTQKIEVTKNLIDISGPTEIDNLFTIVLPTGKNGSKPVYISDYWPIAKSGHAKVPYIKVPELATIPLYTDAELNTIYHKKADYQNAITNFGRIWKPISFDNATTPELLFAYAKDWIKNNFVTSVTQWSVTALDMKIIDSDAQMLLCGDRVQLIHPEVDSNSRNMTIISAEYDLYNPDKNKYTIGIPIQELNSSQNNKSTSKKAKSQISSNPPKTPSPKEDLEPDVKELKQNILTQYYLKKSGENIQLDNPLAFTKYNTDGTLKSKEQAQKEAMAASKRLLQLSISVPMADKLAEAIRLSTETGKHVDPNDTQVLINLDPFNLKLTQSRWKNESTYNYINVLGVPDDQTAVVLNQTAGQSALASMVDDDGNWTESALARGVTGWAQPEKIRQMAINARKELQGTATKSGAEDLFGSITQSVFGVDLNVGNYMNLDSIKKKFGIGENGEIINTEEVTNELSGLVTKGANFLSGLGVFGTEEKDKTSGSGTWLNNTFSFLGNLFTGNDTEGGENEFTLESAWAQLTGTESGGSAGFKSGSGTGKLGGWDITLNKPLTYTANGKTYTVPAKSIAADDLHFTATYDSLRVKLLVVDTLLADYARINTLEAMKASIDDLTAHAITTDTLSSSLSNLDYIQVKGISASDAHAECRLDKYYGNDYCFNVEGGAGSVTSWSIKNFIKAIRVSGPTNNVYTLQYKRYSDSDWQTPESDATFSRATSLSGEWGGTEGRSGRTYTVTATPQDEENVLTLADGNIAPVEDLLAGSWSGNTYTGKIGFQTSVQAGTAHYSDTKLRYQVDGSEPYNSGWGAAYGKVSIPGSGSSGSITVKWPASTVGDQTTRAYELYSDSNNSVILRYNTAASGEQPSYTTAAIITHNKYTSGHTAGWNAAYGKVSIPGSGSGGSITVKWPASTVGDQTTRKYELYSDSNNSVVLRYNKAASGQQPSYVTAATITHNKYTAGYNSGHSQGITDAHNAETAIKMTRGAYDSNSRTYTCTCTVSGTIANASTFYLYHR